MPSTDIDGSPILMLNLNETNLVKEVLEDSNRSDIVCVGILRKIEDVQAYERKRRASSGNP